MFRPFSAGAAIGVGCERVDWGGQPPWGHSFQLRLPGPRVLKASGFGPVPATFPPFTAGGCIRSLLGVELERPRSPSSRRDVVVLRVGCRSPFGSPTVGRGCLIGQRNQIIDDVRSKAWLAKSDAVAARVLLDVAADIVTNLPYHAHHD